MNSELVKDLSSVHRQLLDLASVVEQSIQGVFQAIPERKVAEPSAESSTRLVEVECLRLLAAHHANEHDVKRLSAAYKIADNLGRMAALTFDLARRLQRLAKGPGLLLPADLTHVAELVAGMVRLALESFVELELRVARHIYQLDQEVERYGLGVVEDLVKAMSSCPQQVAAALTVYGTLWQLGNIAKLATDIAGEVVALASSEPRPQRVCSW